MSFLRARNLRRDTHTWPGFVDALATLLMVVIFVLMIFSLAQFYLNQLVSGKDEALINRLGFNNHGAKVILDRIKSNKNLGVLGINVGPNKDSNNRMNDYLIGLKTFHQVADYITINISSPNTENLRNFQEEDKLQELLKSIIKEKNN